MQFSIVSILLVASTASAAALPYPAYKSYFPRQASSINATLGMINTNVEGLTAAVNGYTGGLLAAASVASKQSALDTSIKTATTAVQAMPKLSSADSKMLLMSVGTLTSNTKVSVMALQGKKAEFQAAGLSGTVGTDIKGLQTDTDALGMALVGITSEDMKAQATQTLQANDEVFKQAIAAFAA